MSVSGTPAIVRPPVARSAREVQLASAEERRKNRVGRAASLLSRAAQPSTPGILSRLKTKFGE